MRLRTERLELVAGTAAMFARGADLGNLLACEVPGSWPFENADEHLEVFAAMADQHPEWVPWLFVLETNEGRRLVGDGGFARPPEDGFLVIGYEVAPEHRNQGIATEAVRALCQWAFERADVAAIEALTERENLASQRVLAKVGFKPGGVDEDGYLEYTLTRSDMPE